MAISINSVLCLLRYHVRIFYFVGPPIDIPIWMILHTHIFLAPLQKRIIQSSTEGIFVSHFSTSRGTCDLLVHTNCFHIRKASLSSPCVERQKYLKTDKNHLCAYSPGKVTFKEIGCYGTIEDSLFLEIGHYSPRTLDARLFIF